MATYAVGDVQGCHDELQRLLDAIRFDPAADTAWFTGDLVNRGPDSLGVLRTVRGLGAAAVSVAGNHDLHLVAASLGGRPLKPRDSFQDVLAAPDAAELLAWVRRLPLVHRAEAGGRDWLMVHGALAPQWSADDAVRLSTEASARLADTASDVFFREHMYGNEPDRWSESLAGWDRLRFVINACTRMRVCRADGRIDLRFNGPPEEAPAGEQPWFAAPGRRSAGVDVLFGHWSALGRVAWPEHRAYGLDTGCVWGRSLTAMRLEDGRLFSVKSRFRGSD